MESTPECWDRLGPPVPAVSLACTWSGLAIIVLWGSMLGLGGEPGCSVGGVGSRAGDGFTHGFQLGEIHIDGGVVGFGRAEPCSLAHPAALLFVIYLGTGELSLSGTFLLPCTDRMRLRWRLVELGFAGRFWRALWWTRCGRGCGWSWTILTLP